MYIRRMLTGLGVLGATGASLPVAAQDTAPPRMAFVHVTVIPMDRERVLKDQTVLVEGGRVVALGPAAGVPVPTGITPVDGRGKFLLPGLADMHVHLGYGDMPADDSTAAKVLFFYLANGITTVRDMHSGRGPLDAHAGGGNGAFLKAAVAAGRLLGPHIYTAGDPDVSSPGSAAASTAALKADGYDFVKLSDMHGATVDSIAAAAHRVGLRLVGHAPSLPDRGLERALQMPYASIEHLTGYKEAILELSGRWEFNAVMSLDLAALADTAVWLRPGYTADPARLHAVATATRQAGVWNCPTLVYGDAITADIQPMSPQMIALLRLARRALELDMQLTRALQQAGAGLLTGTDQFDGMIRMPPGFALHRELALLVQAGLTPYEALAASTRNVAEFLGTRDSAGTVAVGKRADLVLLNENPLRDIGATAALAGVMVGGRWFSRAAVDARLDEWRTYGRNAQYDLGEVRRKLWRPPVTAAP